jgi:hypothetical protein
LRRVSRGDQIEQVDVSSWSVVTPGVGGAVLH